ncbi:facilitated trehalose transporter Tret1-like [Macrosteles quadrilineatus]|uniref:facilitated trehalose transporter Tret1-like n=1 Tax=Macrosteles quadrilineatus TaxID=74068 RepID=UPI0023E20FA6|nr:facilitated trehalose transporter Tret1-like [Macrosteles quadrilineatus]
MFGVNRSTARQITTTLAACFIMMSCGTSFGWVAPSFVKLMSEDSVIPMTSSEASWAIAIIEFGNLWSPVPAGILADKLGRKPLALVNGPISIASWVIIMYFKSFLALCIGRILQGFVIGIVFTVVPMYLGEIASQNIRGAVITLSQACFWFGFVYEYVIGPFVSFDTLILFSVCLPAAFLVLFSFQPESPHFYIMREDELNAKKSLMWLRGAKNEEDVKEELAEITESVREEMSHKVSLADIISTPTDRRALLIVQVVSGVKMLSGVAPILAYSTEIYRRTGFTLIPPYMMTIITGLVLFISAFFSTTLTDSAGRRPLLIISCVGCALSLYVVSGFFYVYEFTDSDLGDFSWVIPLCIILYNLFMAFGLDPVSITYRVEMFPAHTRSTAASLNTLVFTIGAFVTLKFYQVVADTFGVYSIFFIFATCSFLGSIWMYFYAIETKNKSLAEVQKELTKMLN